MVESEDRRHFRRSEPMKATIPDSVVKKNFLLYYKTFIDLRKRNLDKQAYAKLLNNLGGVIPSNVFDTNALVICDKPIMSEVFLAIFAKHPKLLSYRVMTPMDISDLYGGRMQLKNLNMTEDETLYAVRDIDEDVLCLHLSKFMQKDITLSVQNMTSVMYSRFSEFGKILPYKVSIVFFRGSKTDLRESKFYGLANFFSTRSNGIILDLNQTKYANLVPEVFCDDSGEMLAGDPPSAKDSEVQEQNTNSSDRLNY